MSARSQLFEHVYQPGAPGNSTVLLLLHGTGGDEHDLLPLGRVLSPGAALLSPRGRVLEHGMPRFFRRLSEGVFDEDDVRVRAGELANFLQACAVDYSFDLTDLVAVGYSNGANIASAVMWLHPGLLTAGILLRPMRPFREGQPAAADGLRLLLSAGLADPIVARSEVESLGEVFREAGAAVTVKWQQAGHNLLAAELEQAAEWLAGPR